MTKSNGTLRNANAGTTATEDIPTSSELFSIVIHLLKLSIFDCPFFVAVQNDPQIQRCFLQTDAEIHMELRIRPGGGASGQNHTHAQECPP